MGRIVVQGIAHNLDLSQGRIWKGHSAIELCIWRVFECSGPGGLCCGGGGSQLTFTECQL
eukprot:3576097-Amphidinium_carterae.1